MNKITLFCLCGVLLSSVFAASQAQAVNGKAGRSYYGYTDYTMPVEHQYGLYPYSYVKGNGYNTYSDHGWYNVPTAAASTQEPTRTVTFQSNLLETTTPSHSDIDEAHERPAYTASKGDIFPVDDRNDFVDGLNHQASNSKIVNLVIGESEEPVTAIQIQKPGFLQQVRSFFTHPLTGIVAVIVPAIFLIVPFIQFMSKFIFGAGQVYEVMTSFAQRAYRNIDEDNIAWIIESISSFESEHLPKTSCVQHILACDTASIISTLPEGDAELVGSVHKQIRNIVKRITGNQGMIGKFLRPFVEGSCGNTECTKTDLQNTMKLFKKLSSKLSSWTLKGKTE